MNASTLIEQFKLLGIELTSEGEQIKVTMLKGKVSEDQKVLLSKYKNELIAFFTSQTEAKLVGHHSGVNLEDPDGVLKTEEIFKEYQYPDGKVLRLTKMEFDGVVEVFRFLLIQNEKPLLAKP